MPPNPGTLKINVHGVHSDLPSTIGNTFGLGVVYRNSAYMMRHVIVGTIPSLSKLGTELWAIYALLRRAMVKGYDFVIVETNNLEAYRVVWNFNVAGVPPHVIDLMSQISILLKNHRWVCVLAYNFPA